MSTTLYAGVDVSKGPLDVALRPTGECFTVPNDDAGIDSLVGRLQRVSPALVVLEATGGGFELTLPAALARTLRGHRTIWGGRERVREVL